LRIRKQSRPFILERQRCPGPLAGPPPTLLAPFAKTWRRCKRPASLRTLVGMVFASAALGFRLPPRLTQPDVVTLVGRPQPACSMLSTAVTSTPISRHASQILRRLGIARADFQIDARYSDRTLTDLRVGRRLYFSAADGPAATAMKQGLVVPGLDSIAIGLARLADRPDVAFGAPPEPYSVYVLVSLFANPRLKWPYPPAVELLPEGGSSSLEMAAATGDVLTLGSILGRRPAVSELNKALYFALSAPSDNSAVISMLLHAGADANADFSSQSHLLPYPLMLAANNSPCDLSVLLDGGARLDSRNAEGQSALDIARAAGRSEAVKILEAVKSRWKRG